MKVCPVCGSPLRIKVCTDVICWGDYFEIMCNQQNLQDICETSNTECSCINEECGIPLLPNGESIPSEWLPYIIEEVSKTTTLDDGYEHASGYLYIWLQYRKNDGTNMEITDEYLDENHDSVIGKIPDADITENDLTESEREEYHNFLDHLRYYPWEGFMSDAEYAP